MPSRLVLIALALSMCVRVAAAQQRVMCDAPAGAPIEGDLYGVGDRAIVLVGHGGSSTRASWTPQAKSLSDAGYRVLVFETRAAIELRQTGKETACLYDAACMSVDVLAAVRCMRSAGATDVSILAGSAGGGAAAQASIDARPGEIDRLILLAPMTIAAPDKIKGRSLYITARDDRNDAGPRLPGIRAQFNRTPGAKRWLVLEGAAHGQRMFDSPEADRLMKEILRFLKERGPDS